jgi:1-acyl-sn-glycerol-3-phosphate acyltransferase
MNLEPKDFQHPFFSRIALPLIKVFGAILMTLLGPYRVRGKYRLPKSGGVLVLANHLADVDPIFVQLASSRPVYFMGKSELFEMPVLGRVMRMFRAFAVKRGEPDREAIKRAVAYLKAGCVVCVFPEGQLSESGELQELKPGVALMVRMAECPVICLGLTNTNRVMPYGSVIPRPAFRLITADWGEAHEFPKGSSTEEIMGWAKGQLESLTNP